MKIAVVLLLFVPDFTAGTAFEDAAHDERERAILKVLSEQKAQRTLLSPAETLNALTVGVWHDDAVTDPPRGLPAIDLLLKPMIFQTSARDSDLGIAG